MGKQWIWAVVYGVSFLIGSLLSGNSIRQSLPPMFGITVISLFMWLNCYAYYLDERRKS